MNDTLGRKITYLRLSVTDLCDLRCIYCMPEHGVPKRAHSEICSLEELCDMAAAAVSLGVRKVRITGGEPLIRRGVVSLCQMLRALPGLEELCLTTNGVRLPELAAPLREAGVDRLNISLDTLRPERYRSITRIGELSSVLRGLDAAEAAGFSHTKLNCVLMGGVNDDEIEDFVRLTQACPLSVRFIELMPMGACAKWEKARFLPAGAVLDRVPELEPAGTVGLIEPMSHAFCAECSRIRITADGKLKPCLHADTEIALRGLHGEALLDAIRQGIARKPERHALMRDGESHAGRCMSEIGG